MKSARLILTALLALAPMTGCGYAVTTSAVAMKRPAAATLGDVALVMPIPDDAVAYAATPWHRARLTVGRFSGAMGEVTQAYVGGRNGLEPVGTLPALVPADDYWVRMELLQDGANGAEHVVGRGWAGDEEHPLTLSAGANAARVAIQPTMADTRIALAPVYVASLAAEDRWPTAERVITARSAPVTTTVIHNTFAPVINVGGTRAAERVEQPWSAPAAVSINEEAPDYEWYGDYGQAMSDDSGYDDDDDDTSWGGGSSDSDSASGDDDDRGTTIGDVIDGWALQGRNPNLR